MDDPLAPGLVTHPRRGDILSRGGGLPWEPCAGLAERCGAGAGLRQTPDSILEHGASGRRVGESEKREDEDVRVPEDVTAIRLSGQTSGAHEGLCVIRCLTHEMEEREADGALQFIVASDDNVCLLPPCRPGTPVLAHQRIDIDVLVDGGLPSP